MAKTRKYDFARPCGGKVDTHAYKVGEDYALCGRYKWARRAAISSWNPHTHQEDLYLPECIDCRRKLRDAGFKPFANVGRSVTLSNEEFDAVWSLLLEAQESLDTGELKASMVDPAAVASLVADALNKMAVMVATGEDPVTMCIDDETEQVLKH